MALVSAIAAGQDAAAKQELKRNPGLIQMRAMEGASRKSAKPFFFDEICHYLNEGDTALHMAAAGYRVNIAKLLIAKGAPVQAKNRMGAEPLHYAADGGPYLPHWDPKAQAGVIKILIKAGADPNALDKRGVSPLHRAVRTRCSAAVEALLKGGADPGLKNGKGSSPLDLASQDTGRGGSGSPEARREQDIILRLLS